MSRKRVWLMDGHNMIFAVHGLQRLQVSGRGEEARQVLAGRLDVFALQRQERVVLVFDSHAMAAPEQGAARGTLLEMVFARGGDGAADEYIVRRARQCSEQGLPVAVVTDDVRTLASRLPGGVSRHGVRAFWLEHIEPPPSADDKQVGGDFSDLEREMLAHAAASERAHPARKPAPPPLPAEPPPAPRDAAGDLHRRKRERGRLRQERLLKRRGAGAGRR